MNNSIATRTAMLMVNLILVTGCVAITRPGQEARANEQSYIEVAQGKTEEWSTQRYAKGGITAPQANSTVRGRVNILGVANVEFFQKYELHYKPVSSGDEAYIYFAGSTAPVIDGVLGVWHSDDLPSGHYSLRLRVVKNTGDYTEFVVQNVHLE